LQFGTMQVQTLSDGYLTLPGALLFAPMPQDELGEILKRHGVAQGAQKADCNITLLRDGDRVVVFDTGSGPAFQQSAGKLADALETAGVAPEDVTDYEDPESGAIIAADEIRPKLRQYLAWLEASGVEVLLKERQVWNLELGYAGSFDLLCRFPNGELWIVDLKTGGAYADHNLQQIAYLMAEFIGQDDVIDDDATALLKRVDGLALLQLSDDGWAFKRLKADRGAWAAFRGLLAFATWTRDHESDFVVAEKAGASADPEAAA